ncbi:hypothetical protein P0L94_13760 [Microbacter sp. GSS18]|nr:hypothetical protein P0L94_13760 [Microbacter sp. GSS18]
MTLNLCSDTAAAAFAAHRLDVVLRDLDAVLVRLADAGLEAGSLSAGTDWSAKAARAFHEAAETWAVEVRALEDAALDLRTDVRIARDRAAAGGAWCR